MATDEFSEKNSNVSFANSAKFFAALGLTGGVLIHFIGYMHHMVYMDAWGVDSQLFPKPIEWLGARGYLTAFTQISSLFSFLSENWLQLLSLSVAIVSCIVIQVLFEKQEKNFDEFINRFTRVKRFLIACFGLVGLTALLILMVLFLARLLIAIPGAIGVKSGKEVANKDLKRFQKGCEQEPGCTSVLKDGKLVARGFLIDSSSVHIALYVPTDKVIRIIPIDGLELARPVPSIAGVQKR